MSAIVRAAPACLAPLPEYPFEPRFVEIEDPAGPLRMHYVDAGPRDADPVLLLHGQPTWSFLWRRVIAALVARGHRAVAPDYVGYGRSDKLTDRFSYTFESHIRWISSFVRALDLRRATAVLQDWGGPLGFALLAREGERFARAVAADTILHTCEPWLEGRLAWANHPIDGGRMVVQEALLEWMLLPQRQRELSPGAVVNSVAVRELSPAEIAAYDAPFPDESHRAGLRQMNALIPVTRGDPAAAIDRESFAALRRWQRPFLTVWGDRDPGTSGWERVFQQEIPGAAGQPHRVLEGCGHFLQEDRGPEFGAIIADFVEATRR